MIADFKAFIMRGNVIDLAVAVIIGAAFGAVVQAAVNSVIMPIVAGVVGQPNFDTVGRFHLGDSEVLPGVLLTAIVNFLLVAASVFAMIKTFEKLQDLRKSGEVETEDASPAPSDEAVLLTEIRDLLRAQR